MKTKEQTILINEIFEKFTYLNEIDFRFIYEINLTEIDSIQEQFIELIQQHEIIYYSVAMQFLMENDCSLNQSLQIAEECGHHILSLNSETLATLLIQSYMFHELNDLIHILIDLEIE